MYLKRRQELCSNLEYIKRSLMMMMMWPMVAVPRFHKKRTIEPLLGDGLGVGGGGKSRNQSYHMEENPGTSPTIWRKFQGPVQQYG